ncbi:MAG: hypothetical protein IPG68_10660 [Micrococcales bacterium]|nr:hypothetical protein [Micrococcales bacterium]
MSAPHPGRGDRVAAPDGLRPRIYCWLARKPDHAEPGTVCFGHVELVRVADSSWIGASGLEMVAVQFLSSWDWPRCCS